MKQFYLVATIASMLLVLGSGSAYSQQVEKSEKVVAPGQLSSLIPDESTMTVLDDDAISPAACAKCRRNNDCCCGSNCCQECCEAVCCPKRVTEEVKKHCWKVNPELVCVPGFRLPWVCGDKSRVLCGDECCGYCQECCEPQCGRIRCVNVLEKHEYTCEECGWEWEVKCIRSARGCCGEADCCPSCGSSKCCTNNETPADEILLAMATEETQTPDTDSPQTEETSIVKRITSWFRR